MEYRAARREDWPYIAAYIARKKYFLPCNPAELGGAWIIAVDKIGAIRGTVWFFSQEPHAYLDYWAADTPRTAARLGVVLERAFREYIGVKYVHGLIATKNTAAARMAIGLGMNAQDGYTLVHKELAEWAAKPPQAQPA